MTKIIDFSNFADELMTTVDGNGAVIRDSVVYGAESLGEDFTVLQTRDRAALVRMDVKDGFAPASDNFVPKQVLEVKSRFASFKEADIDLEIKLSDIKEAYQSYLGWIKTKGQTLNDVYEKPFELYFLDYILARHFEFIRLKTAWKGVYNAAGTGAGSIADGFIAAFAAGRAVTGDIPASHVFTGAAITATNAYDQFNGVANLLATENEKLLAEMLNVYCSLTAYDNYRKNRRTLYKEHVGPGDRPLELDDYSNMKFKVDPGLAGKNTIVITPKKNMLFVVNEDLDKFHINIVKDIKSFKISIRVSVGFDYASPTWTYLNNQV